MLGKIQKKADHNVGAVLGVWVRKLVSIGRVKAVKAVSIAVYSIPQLVFM